VTAAPPLHPTPELWAQWLAECGALCDRSLRESLGTAPAVGRVGAEGLAEAEAVHRPIGETPLPGGLPEILSVLERAVAASLSTQGPGYLAYVPGGGLPASALADLIADVTNRYTGLAAAAPALCRLEADVLSWLAGEFGYGPGARGLLTSGGSLANFSAIVTARHAAFGDDADLSRAVAYVSSQSHHSVAKALRLAAIGPRQLETIEVDDRLRLSPSALRARIRADRAAGRRPFLVVTAGGSTNTGAVDPLAAVAEICESEGLWHHCDAAYGGAFVLCPEGRARLAGIARADSITFDPHKGMFLPYGTGCLLVRDGEALRRAHGAQAEYLQDFDTRSRTNEAPSPTEYGPELSRDFRGLRLWLPLMLHGAAAFREALTEKLALAERFADGLGRAIEGGAPIELVDRPQLSTVPFRLRRDPGETGPDYDRRNAAWLEAINERRRVYLSSTRLPVADGSAFTLRVCVLSFRTHADQIDAALQDVVQTAGVV
jgi:aromatic-L-amino-acid decarboxylase